MIGEKKIRSYRDLEIWQEGIELASFSRPAVGLSRKPFASATEGARSGVRPDSAVA